MKALFFYKFIDVRKSSTNNGILFPSTFYESAQSNNRFSKPLILTIVEPK